MVYKIIKEEMPKKKFKIVGKEDPGLYEKTRKQIKGKFVTPAVEAISGFAGVPGEVLSLVQRLFGIQEPKEILPTGETIKGILEKYSGEKFEPTTVGEEKLGRVARLGGTLAFPVGGEIQAGKALVGALAGTGLETLAEQANAPQLLKDILSTVGSIAPFITRKGVGIPKKGISRLGEIAEKEAIEAPSAATAQKFPKRKLAFAKETKKTLERAQEFEKSIERAKNRIIAESVPFAKTEEGTAKIKEISGKLFESAEKKAQKISKFVPTSNLKTALNKNIAKLNKSPALSTEEESTLRFLEKIKNGLRYRKKLSNLMSFNKSLNKEIDFLKPTAGDKALLDVKDGLMKDIERIGKSNPGFYNDWKKANMFYADAMKFGKIRNLLSGAFTETGINYGKFEKLFADPKKVRTLTSLLGKDQYQRLKDISKLGLKGEEVFKAISKDPRIFNQLERLGNFAIIGATLGRSRGAIGAILTEKIGMHLLRSYMGKVMTDPKFSMHYLNMLKALKIGAKKGFLRTAQIVNDDIEKLKKDIKD